MDQFERQALAREASRKIAAVLRQLELDAGTTVDDISLTSIDVTDIMQADPVNLQSVRIKLRRVAGTEWQT